MDAIREKIALLRKTWETLRDEHLTEDICAAYSPGITLVQLNEVVGVVCEYLDRAKSPKGFAPTFTLARALALGAIESAVLVATDIIGGDDQRLPEFVRAINETLAAFHSLLVYGDKHDVAVDLTMQMQEGLALLDTAQKELRAKLDLLNASSAAEEKLREAVQQVEGLVDKAKQGLTSVTEAAGESGEQLDFTKADREEIKVTQAASDELLKSLQETRKSVEEEKLRLVALNEQSKKQSELISSLLPKGASAGLAHAFGARARALEQTKWIWMGVFITSIFFLALMAYRLLALNLTSHEDLWVQLLHRVPLASPLIWLGWFSAVQYGNTIRVQEDYAFKEATSNAFAGYRDHMEHLAGIDSQEGASALALLATKTIEILSREPLRIYNKPDRDVTPAQSIAAILKSKLARQEIKAAKEVAEE